jgi:hypothetical protein
MQAFFRRFSGALRRTVEFPGRGSTVPPQDTISASASCIVFEQKGEQMASASKTVANEIARYRSGSKDDQAVGKNIEKAWRELVDTRRDEVAKLLEVPASSLDPTKPPFRAETQAGGITGVEIAVVFVGGFIVGVVKDLGTEAGTAAAKKVRTLWNEYMAKEVSNPKDPALGKRIDSDS